MADHDIIRTLAAAWLDEYPIEPVNATHSRQSQSRVLYAIALQYLNEFSPSLHFAAGEETTMKNWSVMGNFTRQKTMLRVIQRIREGYHGPYTLAQSREVHFLDTWLKENAAVVKDISNAKYEADLNHAPAEETPSPVPTEPEPPAKTPEYDWPFKGFRPTPSEAEKSPKKGTKGLHKQMWKRWLSEIPAASSGSLGSVAHEATKVMVKALAKEYLILAPRARKLTIAEIPSFSCWPACTDTISKYRLLVAMHHLHITSQAANVPDHYKQLVAKWYTWMKESISIPELGMLINLTSKSGAIHVEVVTLECERVDSALPPADDDLLVEKLVEFWISEAAKAYSGASPLMAPYKEALTVIAGKYAELFKLYNFPKELPLPSLMDWRSSKNEGALFLLVAALKAVTHNPLETPMNPMSLFYITQRYKDIWDSFQSHDVANYNQWLAALDQK